MEHLAVIVVVVVLACAGCVAMVLRSVLERAEADGEALRALVLRLSFPPDDAVPAAPEAPGPDGPFDWLGRPVIGTDPTDGLVPEPWSLGNESRAVVLEPGEDPWPHLVGGRDAEWP